MVNPEVKARIKRTLVTVKPRSGNEPTRYCPKGADLCEFVATADLLALVPTENAHWAYTTIRCFPGYGEVIEVSISPLENPN